MLSATTRATPASKEKFKFNIISEASSGISALLRPDHDKASGLRTILKWVIQKHGLFTCSICSKPGTFASSLLATLDLLGVEILLKVSEDALSTAMNILGLIACDDSEPRFPTEQLWLFHQLTCSMSLCIIAFIGKRSTTFKRKGGMSILLSQIPSEIRFRMASFWKPVSYRRVEVFLTGGQWAYLGVSISPL